MNMDKTDINELIKAAASALDLSHFKGDVVMYKHVEKEINIAAGGIGEQHIHYGTDGGHTAAKPSAPTEETEEEDTPGCNNDRIPADCEAAVGKVLVPTFTINKVELSSRQQLVKAAAQVNTASNSEVAMLMAVAQEVNAVRPGVSCRDFVRALIGMGVIAFTDIQAIDRMADGMTKKLNGYSRGDKQYPPLPAHHLRWKSDDQSIGRKIHGALTSPG